MKKIYLLCSLAILAGTAASQPTLTQANATPLLGETYTFKPVSWNGGAVSAGANQTWDYSGLVSTGTTAVAYVTPASCPSAASFPGSTVAANYASGAQYEFNKITATAFERLGFYAGSTAIPLSNSEKLLSFPFTFNNTFTDPFGGTFTSNGVALTRAGDVTVTADGYGTLMLPGGVTLTNVLRVKVSEDYGDSYNGAEIYHYNTDVYMFYKPGAHLPVLALTHYEQGTTVTNYGNYIDGLASLSTNELSMESVSVYPNPATEKVNINWGETKSAGKTEIFNLSGMLVYASEEAESSVDIHGFDKGVYLMHLSNEEGHQVVKFIKE